MSDSNIRSRAVRLRKGIEKGGKQGGNEDKPKQDRNDLTVITLSSDAELLDLALQGRQRAHCLRQDTINNADVDRCHN